MDFPIYSLSHVPCLPALENYKNRLKHTKNKKHSERERERQTDRQREKDREKEKERLREGAKDTEKRS